MQHITEPTIGRDKNEPSLLDLALTNDDTAISTIETASGLGKSDHSVIKVVLNCTPTYEPISKTVYKYDKGDYTKMEDLLNIDWEAEFSNHQGDVQACYRQTGKQQTYPQFTRKATKTKRRTTGQSV